MISCFVSKQLWVLLVSFIAIGHIGTLTALDRHGYDISGIFSSASEVLKTGTTIVGLCCKDGVVLGADTRSTGGPLVMDKHKLKIHKISRHMYCCAAGTSADCTQISRRTSYYLALHRIGLELAGDFTALDSVAAAASHITQCLTEGPRSGRAAEAVFILGGVDQTGPNLFRIGADGLPVRVSFAALGSGSTDAIAVLETARLTWNKDQQQRTERMEGQCFEDIGVKAAVHVVKKAVQAGIDNDLGSGSHVDICVVTAESVKLWRESFDSTFGESRKITAGNLQSLPAAAPYYVDTSKSLGRPLHVTFGLPGKSPKRFYPFISIRKDLSIDSQIIEYVDR